jgi:HipA-like protein
MIRLFLDRAHEGKRDILVGTLSQEEGDFVFRYDPGYVQLPGARPISAFPELLKEYKEKVLWPFFAARIPPLDREDVRAEIAKSHLQPHDTIRMLGTLSTKTITNPYRFELAAAAYVASLRGRLDLSKRRVSERHGGNSFGEKLTCPQCCPHVALAVNGTRWTLPDTIP